MKKPILALVLAAASMLSQAAVFDGKTAQFQYYNRNLNRPVGGPVILTPGIPYNFQNAFNIKIIGNNIVIDFLQSNRFNGAGDFSGFKISDVKNQFSDFKSFSILSNNGMPSLTNSGLSFDANNLFVNWRGLNFTQGKSMELSVVTAPVPEPETYALMGLGLVGLLAARRRKALNVQN